jgi:hypothetical protein
MDRANANLAGTSPRRIDASPAFPYLEAAVSGGSVEAMVHRGTLEMVHGPDSARAATFFQRAFDAGHLEPAAFWLYFYYVAQRTPEDSARAESYAERMRAQAASKAPQTGGL